MSSNKWDQPKMDQIADLTLYPMTIYPICSVITLMKRHDRHNSSNYHHTFDVIQLELSNLPKFSLLTSLFAVIMGLGRVVEWLESRVWA